MKREKGRAFPGIGISIKKEEEGKYHRVDDKNQFWVPGVWGERQGRERWAKQARERWKDADAGYLRPYRSSSVDEMFSSR